MNLDWEEENDRPRGIVAKANKYAASKVPIALVGSELSEPVLAGMQAIYLMHFNTFIAGAHAALELSNQECKPPARREGCEYLAPLGEGCGNCGGIHDKKLSEETPEP